MPGPGLSTGRAAERAHVWQVLVPRLLSDARLVIVEALLWVREPMSAVGLARMLEDPSYTAGMFSYHLRVMVEKGMLVQTEARSVRGAEELFFYFAPAQEGEDRSPAGAHAT